MLRAAASLWGVAIAIALFPIVVRPAPSGQLPGLNALQNIDEHSPFRFVALLVILPLIAPWILRPVIALLERGNTQRWARNSAILSMLVPLWFVSIEPKIGWATIPTAFALIVILLLRHNDVAFSRHDAILIPTFATVFLALIDLTRIGMYEQFVLALAIVFATRVAVAVIPRSKALEPAACFAIAPLALILQSGFVDSDLRHLGWPPLLIAVLTPFLLRLSVRLRARQMRRLIAFVIFPIVALAYPSATSQEVAEGKARADLFENAHVVVPGAEMLRGEKPYRDIIPPHGLISDAVVSYLTLRSGAPTIGRVVHTRLNLELLNWPAAYLLTFAATGSPEAGILSVFLAAVLGTGGGQFRILPAMLTLALLAAALRLRSMRFLAAAGAGVVISIVTGFDFGVYAAITSIVTVLLFGGARRRALASLAIPAAVSAAIVAIALAVWGILGDFVRYAIVKIPELRAVYALPPMGIPEGLKKFRFPPEVLAAVFDKNSDLYILWFAVLIGVAVTAGVRIENERRRSRSAAIRIIAVFILVCSISWAERHHLYFRYAMAPMIAAALFAAFHSRQAIVRTIAPALVVLVLIIAQPTIHLAIVGTLRNARGPVDAGFRAVSLPRARGAYFSAIDAQNVESTARYVQSRLSPSDTFFDFTNQGTLYFLLDRPCPIRQIEVGFYESEAEQRKVIAAIESNPHVRAALIPPPNPIGLIDVDGIPNSTRAPLVWAYLQQHFGPDFAQGGVVFWRRK